MPLSIGPSLMYCDLARVASVSRVSQLPRLQVDIKADGGLTPAKSGALVRAGATSLVAGTSSVFTDHRYRPGSLGEMRAAIAA